MPQSQKGETEEQLHSFLTSDLDGSGFHAPTASPPDGPHSQSGRSGDERNRLPLPWLEPRTVQP
jgi:hypothetical protein